MISNYKIKVNNEAESKEAQELFFAIGLIKDDFDDYDFPYYVASNDDETFTNYILGSDTSNWKELTLPQLRDLVAQSKSTEQGLISGADALRALADGKGVEFQTSSKIGFWRNVSETIFEYREILGEKSNQSDVDFKFRLKPRTITLNIEIPAPFEPKEGETYWCFSTQTVLGYGHNVYESKHTDRRFMNMGAWRTEEEIKQVVSALRGAICKK